MIVTPIRTKKILPGDNLENMLKDSLPKLQEKSVVVVTSKIVSITEGSIAPLTEDKEKLIQQEADLYESKQTMLTIKDNILVPWAGIDESNGNGMYILWPKDPMLAAEKLWRFLQKEYVLKEVGVIISDSTFIPLRTGSVSVGIAWCGFAPLKNYIGQPDIFGKPLEYTTTSFVDGIAIAAGLPMGEGSQQQPLAVITDIPDISFVQRVPTEEEMASMHYPMDKDLFGPLLQAVDWEKGGEK